MRREAANEIAYIVAVASAGAAWIAPLANSIPAEAVIADDAFIDLDLGIIRQMEPGRHVLLMRPGWRAHDGLPESKGGRREYSAGTRRGLRIIEPVNPEQAAHLVRSFVEAET